MGDVGFVKDGLLTRRAAPNRRFQIGAFVSGLTVETVDASKNRLTLTLPPKVGHQREWSHSQTLHETSLSSWHSVTSFRGRTTSTSPAPRRIASSSPVPKRS